MDPKNHVEHNVVALKIDTTNLYHDPRVCQECRDTAETAEQFGQANATMRRLLSETTEDIRIAPEALGMFELAAQMYSQQITRLKHHYQQLILQHGIDTHQVPFESLPQELREYYNLVTKP